MARNPFCQAFELQSGQIVELAVDDAESAYLMTESNVIKYCEGRDDYEAEGSMPFASPIELVAADKGWWYLISEHQLRGRYRLRLGIRVTEGQLEMRRVRSAAP
jgi:hypothetical protein